MQGFGLRGFGLPCLDRTPEEAAACLPCETGACNFLVFGFTGFRVQSFKTLA